MKDPINKKLLPAFVLSTVLCAGLFFLDPALLLFATALPFFCLQLLLLRGTGRLWLRLLPALPIALLLGAAGYYALFGRGWDTLAALILALLSIAPAAGCLLALGVHRFSGVFLSRKWLIVLLTLLGCAGAWLGQEISLGYWDRAFIKALSFGCCAGLYPLLCRKPFSPGAPLEGEPMTEIFRRPDRTSLNISAALALGVFLFLTVGYMLLAPWLDLSAIPEKLRLSGITAETFPAVALFITVCNSFLEEFFFRGFAFLTLRRQAGEGFACVFSGLAFAAYHVSIMDGWFHPIWFALFLAGLAVGGMLFNFLDRKGGIWCGWLVHAAANLAINLIGMRMFAIL